MQQLHLVGFTADNRGLIFSARKGSKSGGFVVTLDDKLLSRVDEMVARREAEEQDSHSSSRPKSSLSPREIQARLRAGRSIAQVAREAGVEEEWVARWAAPILAEQNQVVERAQELTMEKNRVGPSAVPLGDAVRWNMADKGIVFTDAGWAGSWEAFHLRDNSWMVRFTYVYRRATHQAEWEVDTRAAVVISRNRQATDLGFVAPGRRRPKMPRSALAVDLPSVAPAVPAPAAPVGEGASPEAPQVAKKSARKAAAKKQPSDSKKVAARTAAAKKKWAAIKKAADRKAAADRIAARKAAAKKAAAAKKEAERKAAAKKLAAKKAAASKKSAAKKATAKKATAKKATAKKSATNQAASKKSTARKSPARKSTARKAPTKKTTPRSAGAAKKSSAPKSSATKKAASKSAARSAGPSRTSARKTTARKSGAGARANKTRPPAPVPMSRSPRPAAEPARFSARSTASRPAQAANGAPARPDQSSTARSARRAARADRPESRGPLRQEADGASPEVSPLSDREPETESPSATPARAPIRIDSGVPRRGDSNGAPIIRAERADQSRAEPAGVGARSSDPGAARQGRFRFRRNRGR